MKKKSLYPKEPNMYLAFQFASCTAKYRKLTEVQFVLQILSNLCTCGRDFVKREKINGVVHLISDIAITNCKERLTREIFLQKQKWVETIC